jgi:hypothetical protein
MENISRFAFGEFDCQGNYLHCHKRFLQALELSFEERLLHNAVSEY